MTAKKLVSVLAIAGLLAAGSAFAQTGTTPSGTGGAAATTTGTGGTAGTGAGVDATGSGAADTSATTPGVPNTGAGGDGAMNLLLLGVSAAIALAGAAYLSRRWADS